MPDPGRIQLRRTAGWKMPPDAVKADRSTEWGNPFVVGFMTHVTGPTPGRRRWFVESGSGHRWADSKEEAQDMAVKLYRAWVLDPKRHLLRDRIRLMFRRKRPACWCREGSPCHGDIIAEIAATPLECETA